MAPLCRSRDHGSRHAKPTRPGLQVDTQCSRSGQLNSDPHPTSQQPVSTQTLDIPLSSTSMIYVFKLLRNGEISWLNSDIDKYIYVKFLDFLRNRNTHCVHEGEATIETAAPHLEWPPMHLPESTGPISSTIYIHIYTCISQYSQKKNYLYIIYNLAFLKPKIHICS